MQSILTRALMVAFALTALVASPASAARINVDIETPDEPIFYGTVSAGSTAVPAEVIGASCAANTNPVPIEGVNPITALAAAVEAADVTWGTSGDKYSFGVMVCRIADFAGDSSNYWLVKVNNKAKDVTTSTALKKGDNVLWYLTDGSQTSSLELRLPSKVRYGKNATGRVYKWDNMTDGRTPAAGARVELAGKTYKADKTGKVKIRVKAKGPQFARATLALAIPSSDSICVFKKRATECR